MSKTPSQEWTPPKTVQAEAPKYVIPWDTIITDIDGTEMIDSITQEANPLKKAGKLTLAIACRHALTIIVPSRSGEDVPQNKKFEWACLATDIYKGEAPTLDAETITELKERIAKLYGPVVVMRAYYLLDPATKRK